MVPHAHEHLDVGARGLVAAEPPRRRSLQPSHSEHIVVYTSLDWQVRHVVLPCGRQKKREKKYSSSQSHGSPRFHADRAEEGCHYHGQSRHPGGNLIQGNLFFFSLASTKITTQFILTSNTKTFV